jgi:AcrR family transcriptional regulator
MSKRLQPDDRKAQILDGALELAQRKGLGTITRETIAQHVGVSPALVSLYLGTMTELRRTLMRHAIKREVLEIVAEGLATRDKQAAKAPDDLKRRALATVIRA